MQAQVYNEMDPSGTITQRDEFGQTDPNDPTNRNFNPNSRDSLRSNKEVPKGVKAWTVDRLFGDRRPCELDTMPPLYQNTIYNTGIYGEYNTIGNNYTARMNRIFIDRRPTSQFFFVDGYDYMNREPDQFLFVNTLSPYTNISYDNCGDKQNGEDHIDAKFGINAGKKIGFGFDLDYHYARGYYQNQSTSHFRASLFGSYIGDRYQMHVLGSFIHRKASENGGIVNDNHITHPELSKDQYSEEEIPTVLSQNWNRNDSRHLFLTHRYNFGFYRKVKMTDDEIKARQFAANAAKQKKDREARQKKDGDDAPKGRGDAPVAATPTGRPADAKIMGDEPTDGKPVAAADSTRIKVDGVEAMDSLRAEQARQDSIDATMKREYVPVTSIIHTLDFNHYNRIYQAYNTPADYYANTYYDLNDEGLYAATGIFDKYKYTSVKNTFGLALLEGFNKYVKAGLKAFLSYEVRRFQQPELAEGANAYYLDGFTGHCVNVGGVLSKTQGKTFHFNLGASFGLAGMEAGSVAVDFKTDVNFKLLGDTVRLAANAFFHRTPATYFQEHYHSKHLWWENSLTAQTHTHAEGRFTYEKTNTTLRFAIDEIQNYTYFGMQYNYNPAVYSGRTGLTGGVFQESQNISVITAQLKQHVRLGIINWENVLTYQNSSHQDVLPVPRFNIFTNLYLKFRIAKVLTVELGGSATYFTRYYAPDYLPQLSVFAIQQNDDSRVEIGGHPYIDVYANMHLKRARFFLSMSHVNAGSGSKDYFLTPHYPTNTSVLRFGVSWNFYN